MKFIPINDPQWEHLLKDGNEGELYKYCAEYFDTVYGNYGRPTRDLMPTVYERDLKDGIHEVVKIHFGWFTECKVWDITNTFVLHGGEKVWVDRRDPAIIMYGKLHYLWTKGNETISCIERKMLDRMIWETCHPDFTYNNLSQAKATALAYFEYPEFFDKINEITEPEAF